ncbi:MAG: carboxypeptidase regulatory-like domain-containing protein, partial [Clostridiales Family XIII bacterium]|nr:carboxypeptidase regulatory-like domain-containing protein [Clostridiales Family XIII bacterium]
FVPTPSAYAAASGTISGTVTDMNGGTALADIKVELTRTRGAFNKTVKTGADGKYSFTGLVNGEYTLIVDGKDSGYPFDNHNDRAVIEISATAQSKVIDVQVGKEEHKVSGSINWVPDHLVIDKTSFSAQAYRLNAKTNKYESIGAFGALLGKYGKKDNKYEIYLPAGTYKIAFEYSKQDAGKDVTYQWYNKKKDEKGADIVKVDKDITGINAINPTKWQKQADGTWKCSSYDTMLTGWKQVNGKWYHFTPKGTMQSGWQKIKNKWYYLGTAADGAMKTGWKKVNNKWYYLGTANDGAMKTGWKKINNKWYFLKADGSMVTGTQKISGKKYVFNTSGAWVN